MKTRVQLAASSRGIMLAEALVYIAVLVVVFGAGSSLLYRAWSNNIAVRRNADDIVHALDAGELWRADIRKATGPVVAHDGNEMHIPTVLGEIVYQYANESISRRAPGQQPRNLVRVANSQMQPERRPQVSGWRWELELKHNRKDVQFKPLFTFEAVAGGDVKK
jgi:hypothetical protein